MDGLIGIIDNRLLAGWVKQGAGLPDAMVFFDLRNASLPRVDLGDAFSGDNDGGSTIEESWEEGVLGGPQRDTFFFSGWKGSGTAESRVTARYRLRRRCAAGSEASGSLCLPCAAGTFRDASMAACAACSAGTFSLGGAASCTPKTCDVGYALDASSGGCAAAYCEAGAQFEAPDCVACAAGTYQDGDMLLCAPCAAGTYALGNAAACSVCGAGTYSAGGASSCSPCAAGTYSLGNASSCVPKVCERGSVLSPSSGECEAVNCAAGTQFQGAECVACAPGSFRNDTMAQCDLCAPGTYALGGATLCTAKACDAGYALDASSGECVAQCGEGYALDASSGECVAQCGGPDDDGSGCAPLQEDISGAGRSSRWLFRVFCFIFLCV